MKIARLMLFLSISLLLASCQKSQVVGKIAITTALENLDTGNGSPLVLHWTIEVQEEAGIDLITIAFSDSSTPLEFPNILRDSWSINDSREFAPNILPESWTITVRVRNQEGNISEETSTIDLQ